MLWLWRQLPASGIYNLGTGAASSFRALMEATGAVCGGPPKIEYVDTPEAIRPNYQYKTEAKMERLRALGYNAPFTPLEEAVEDFAVNYLANPDPYL
jgi:ADP-L-glycero-D-manno-heptose 6-epimerase